MDRRRAGTTAALGALAVALAATAVVLLLGWAATIGPADVLEGDGVEPVRITSTPTVLATPDAAPGPPERASDDDRVTRPGVGRVILGVLVAGAAALAGLTVRALLRAWRRRDRGADEPMPPTAGGEPLATPGEVAAGLRADAEQQRALLGSGAPAEAIVACWHRFQATAASAGARRQVWETPAEHVARVLRTVGADESAVHRLADLYREARFSTHPLTEADRARAAAALADVHASLGRTGRVPS